MRRHLLRTSAFVIGFAAAFAAGYWVSSQLGTEALRVEAQSQLASLMHGRVQIGRARLVIRGGLFLEGERVGVYPSPSVPHTPDLFASRVSAELDVLALLMGRFRLRGLTLNDAVFVIERDAAGGWSPYPIQAAANRRKEDDIPSMERKLDVLRAFEGISRVLLVSPVVARRIDVHNSRILFVDSRVPRDGEEPLELGLIGIEGRLVHHWLSNDADLRLRAMFTMGKDAGVPVQVEGRQRHGDELRLVVTADRLPLRTFEDYLAPQGRDAYLDGAFSGEMRFDTRAKGQSTLALRGMIEDFVSIVDLGDGHFELKRPIVSLDTLIELHLGRVRLARTRIEAGGIQLEVSGTVERPLRNAARMRISVEVGGLGLADARELLSSLPDRDSVTLERLLARVDTGRIVRLGGTGVAHIEEWGDLVLGKLDRLPRGFVLRATLAEVRLVAGDTGQLSDLMADVEISGDRLSLRNTSAYWNRERLPSLDLSIHGISHLFQGPGSHQGITRKPAALPGLGALLDMMAGDRDDQQPDGDPRPPNHLLINVERLEHPLLRWPIADARVAVERTERGLQMSILKGRWAGAPIEGEIRWTSRPERALSIDVIVAPPPTGDTVAPLADAEGGAAGVADTNVASVDETTHVSADAWLYGRFEMDRFDGARIPLSGVSGRFALAGSRIDLSQLRADVLPTGKLVAGLTLDLDQTEEVGAELKFQIVAADVGTVGTSFGLPEGFGTGNLHLAGKLAGAVRPQTPILTALRGEMRMDARDGRLYRDELPLVVALAHASEGYNEYADQDSIVFEQATAKLNFAHGRLITHDFHLEGPLRIYASGQVDVINPPFQVWAVVGLFLFRGAGQLMENIPLVKAFLPGSERGLVGAYYRVTGSFGEPEVVALRGKSIEEDLPDVLAAPYQMLRALLSGEGQSGGRRRSGAQSK